MVCMARAADAFDLSKRGELGVMLAEACRSDMAMNQTNVVAVGSPPGKAASGLQAKR